VNDVLEMLNRHFRPRGVEFLAAGEGEADWTITLWWKEFGGMAQGAFEGICRRQKEGGKPSKISVFFKEPDEGITTALKSFKETFEARYGHIQWRYEGLDTVRFQITAQSLPFLPGGGGGVLQVEDSKIKLGGELVAELDNLPFARLNAKRQSLLRQARGGDREIEDLKEDLAGLPNDGTLADALRTTLVRRREIREELQRYEQFLFDTALFFARESGRLMDERTRKAQALFERGKVRAANEILDLGELIEQDERDDRLYREALETRRKGMQGFLDMAELLGSMGGRENDGLRAQALEAYRTALDIGREIFCEETVLEDIRRRMDALSPAG
jgi:tetratricopeptide (TPR) repeat protein